MIFEIFKYHENLTKFPTLHSRGQKPFFQENLCLKNHLEITSKVLEQFSKERYSKCNGTKLQNILFESICTSKERFIQRQVIFSAKDLNAAKNLNKGCLFRSGRKRGLQKNSPLSKSATKYKSNPYLHNDQVLFGLPFSKLHLIRNKQNKAFETVFSIDGSFKNTTSELPEHSMQNKTKVYK